MKGIVKHKVHLIRPVLAISPDATGNGARDLRWVIEAPYNSSNRFNCLRGPNVIGKMKTVKTVIGVLASYIPG
jgi:hypothetical protein